VRAFYVILAHRETAISLNRPFHALKSFDPLAKNRTLLLAAHCDKVDAANLCARSLKTCQSFQRFNAEL
jgi:hypothetical protein